MSRKKTQPKKNIVPAPKFNSTIIPKLINSIMFDGRKGVAEKIPGVIHVDNTCRIQTVNEKQNPVLYKILKLFNKKTGIPILMNTSFNLAGETLVETPEDAIETFNKSDIDCIYFPDIQKVYK